jgi:prepilin-type N-terminal cleavage/methylation domain-containing protein
LGLGKNGVESVMLRSCGSGGRRRFGFTLIELAVVACVVGVMATVLLNRIQFYQKLAEKTAVDQTVGIIQSALQLQFASFVVRNRVEDARYLVGQNPMKWLAQKPSNYAGEYFGKIPDIESGQWYFDLQDRSLVYLVRNGSTVGLQRPQTRYRIRLIEGSTDSPVKSRLVDGKSVEGVVLDQTLVYSWK